MAELGKPEILVLLLLVLVLFGSKRLPGAARSLGQSLRILKAETRGLHDDEASRTPSSALLPAPAAPAALAPVPAPAPPALAVADAPLPVPASSAPPADAAPHPPHE